jgi:hypothetical protein
MEAPSASELRYVSKVLQMADSAYKCVRGRGPFPPELSYKHIRGGWPFPPELYLCLLKLYEGHEVVDWSAHMETSYTRKGDSFTLPGEIKYTGRVRLNTDEELEVGLKLSSVLNVYFLDGLLSRLYVHGGMPRFDMADIREVHSWLSVKNELVGQSWTKATYKPFKTRIRLGEEEIVLDDSVVWGKSFHDFRNDDRIKIRYQGRARVLRSKPVADYYLSLLKTGYLMPANPHTGFHMSKDRPTLHVNGRPVELTAYLDDLIARQLVADRERIAQEVSTLVSQAKDNDLGSLAILTGLKRVPDVFDQIWLKKAHEESSKLARLIPNDLLKGVQPEQPRREPSPTYPKKAEEESPGPPRII